MFNPHYSIRVTFSIDDLNNMDPEADPYDEDAALGDEDGEAVPSNIPGSAQSGGANSKGAINQGQTSGGNINVAPEDRVAPADREDLADEEPEDGGPDSDNEPSFPARMNVSIEKKGKGTLQVETTANEGAITIESVNYFRDAKLAEPSSAEAQWKRSALYEGPPFGNLDEDLQVLLERYLDERGINTQLAVWVPEYIDFKEQREYLGWLSSKSSSGFYVQPFVPCKFSITNMDHRCKRLCGRIDAELEIVAGIFFLVYHSTLTFPNLLDAPSALCCRGHECFTDDSNTACNQLRALDIKCNAKSNTSSLYCPSRRYAYNVPIMQALLVAS